MRIFSLGISFATLCHICAILLASLVSSSFWLLVAFSAALQLHLYMRESGRLISCLYTLKTSFLNAPLSFLPWMCLCMRSDSSDPRWTPIRRRECDLRTEMRCDDGGCVLLRRKCDNIFDCLDGSDERGCGKGFTSHSPSFFSFLRILIYYNDDKRFLCDILPPYTYINDDKRFSFSLPLMW